MIRSTRILVVRTDRIGDVVLSLPVAAALRRRHPDAFITMLVNRNVRDIVEDHPDLDDVIDDTEADCSGTYRLVRRLRRGRYGAAILLHPTPRLALALALARIPLRIGTGYRLYSFLFNHRVWEHRKTGLRHESEYNLSLTAPLGVKDQNVDFHLPVQSAALGSVEQKLAGIQLDRHHPLVVIHPGTRGSALDWPPESFARLADGLVRKAGARVIITGGRGEQSTVENVLRAAKAVHHAFVDCLTLKELIALLSRADLVVANSTGPLHIAAALGTRVIGLYPPVVPMSPVRWGPYAQRQYVVVPEAGPCRQCIRDGCAQWNCMEKIPVEKVLNLSLERLKES